MYESIDTPLSRTRLFVAVIYVIACLLVLSFVIAVIWKIPSALAQESRTKSDSVTTQSEVGGGPNVVAGGMFSALSGATRIADSGGQAFKTSLGSVTQSTATAASSGAKVAVHGVGSGASFVADGMSSGLNFVVGGVGGTFSFIASTPPVSSIIKPADKAYFPEIDTDKPSPADVKYHSLAADNAHQTQDESDAIWPIRGEVTAAFGVPHWPYQPTHTGIDITDGQHSGVTPIKPFKAGRVIETVVSNIGFGNHVIIDHGGGLTSLYGHMYPSSIAVEVGQEVNQSTILGYEGTTGASTGTHLHFEIRLNGQPVDPRRYVSGQP